MQFSLNNIEMEFPTPQELLTERGTSTQTNRHQVRSELAAIYADYGDKKFANSASILHRIVRRLEDEYSFVGCFDINVSLGILPNFYDTEKDTEDTSLFIETMVMVLQALGWIVEVDIRNDYVYFHFLPLKALSATEVEAEIAKIVFRVGARAMGIINQGLIRRKYVYSGEELQFPDDLEYTHYISVVEWLQAKFGDSWKVGPGPADYSIAIYKAVP